MKYSPYTLARRIHPIITNKKATTKDLEELKNKNKIKEIIVTKNN